MVYLLFFKLIEVASFESSSEHSALNVCDVDYFLAAAKPEMAPNNALQKSDLGNEGDDDVNSASPLADDSSDESFRERGGMVTSAEVRSRGDGVNKLGGQSSELKRFLVALMFLTRLPCPRWVDHSPADLVPGMTWFPLIGSFVGLFASAWFDALETLFPPLVAASGSTLMAVWLTGCFHEDGLADTMDSFGGGWGRAQILRIMKVRT